MFFLKINLLLICLFLSSCSNFLKIRTDKTVDSFYVANRLEAKFPELENRIHLDDRYYHLVDKKQIESLANIAWKPWIAEKGDCDDQVSRMLYYIREKYYISNFASSPPAIGQLTCHIRGDKTGHAVLWLLTDEDLFLFDPRTQDFIYDLSVLTPWVAYSK